MSKPIISEDDLSSYSDLYKSVNGVRPRGEHFASYAEFDAKWNLLVEENNLQRLEHAANIIYIDSYFAGQQVWKNLFNSDEVTFELPHNPYGDEWNNPPAQAFRRGFEAAARNDGYTYSKVNGEYCENGEQETDDFPEPGDI